MLAAAGDAAQAANPTDKPANPLGMLPLLIIIVGLFYFMVIRPQKNSQKKTEDMRNSIKKGDRVKSIGGIHGVVTAVDTTNNIVSVQVDRNVKLDFDRSAIATVTRKEDAKQNRDTGKQQQIEKEEAPAASEEKK